MKIRIKKEFDGTYFVAYCLNLQGCYVQAPTEAELTKRLQHAFNLYKSSYEQHGQQIPDLPDKPLINIRIRFTEISTMQLVKVFKQRNYYVEFEDEYAVLMVNTDFPFNRVHLPKFNSLSRLIIQRIFGDKNTIYIPKSNLKLNKSVS